MVAPDTSYLGLALQALQPALLTMAMATKPAQLMLNNGLLQERSARPICC
uniref:Uncharacterized protein n=1 Tax=Rheinheimera sp. BAL341 TaxID=1708203 RepID=A0A486XVG1_9GAMM